MKPRVVGKLSIDLRKVYYLKSALDYARAFSDYYIGRL
jgi:hypothetical protein